ncbi:MAG: flagellar biosynthetic protein FliR [Caldilineaceae bacterium]
MGIPISFPYTFFLLFIRLLSFVSIAPIFSQRSFPNTAKIGLAALVAFVLAPLSPVQSLPESDLRFFTLVVQEIMVGLLLGFAVQLPILAIAMIGQLVASSMGLSYATSISPVFGDMSPPVGQFYQQLAVLIFILLRADHVVLLGLKQMLDMVPPGFMLAEVMQNAGDVLVGRLVYFTNQLWLISLQLALPIVGAVLLADLALVLISRAMPRMNAFSLSLPLKVLMGLLVSTFAFPYLWPQLMQVLDRSGQQMLMLFR